MATAAIINQEPLIVPLEEASIAGLETLFDEQCDEWFSLLGWDYAGPSELIREVARQRNLSGFAAIAGGATVGIAFYVIEDDRCSIGDIYVSKPWRAVGIDRRLAVAILNKLALLPRLYRIESQCVSIDNDGANELFEVEGFERFERHYMMVDLASRPATGRPVVMLDISIRKWEEDDFSAAARIIHRSYRGEHDSRINCQYATEEGCAELLSVLIEHVWCGDFLPRVSRVAVASASGKPLGVLIASRIAEGVGHISQISLLPAYQGMGIGRRMIESALAEFERRDHDSVSLAVTSANAGAFHLYQSCGFRTRHQFPVFYRER